VIILTLMYSLQFFGKMPQIQYARKTWLISGLSVVGAAVNTMCRPRRMVARKSATFLTLVGPRRAAVGYAVTEGEHVWELSLTAGAPSDAALSAVLAYQRERGHQQCSLHLHPSHPAARALFGRNHTMSIRRAWDGGHMAAPLHRAAARRLARVGLGSPRAGDQGDAVAWPVWSPLDEF